MPTSTVDIREQRAKLIADARAILDTADKEKRQLAAEERQQYDVLWKQAEAKRGEIEDAERRNDLEREEAELSNRQKEDAEKRRKASDDEKKTKLPPIEGQEFVEVRQTKEYHDGFIKRWMGRGQLSEEEQRAQIAGKGEKGGYLYASEQFMMELLKDVDDATPFRAMARKFQLSTSDSLGTPVLTSKMGDAE